MEENAKRALFIGVAIFISIITISIVIVAISAADKAETIAKEYTGQGIKRYSTAQSLLGKDKLTGERNNIFITSCKEIKNYNISMYNQAYFPKNLVNTNINNNPE